jgi:hypothetical protein
LGAWLFSLDFLRTPQLLNDGKWAVWNSKALKGEMSMIGWIG